jgi:hypothetical protein
MQKQARGSNRSGEDGLFDRAFERVRCLRYPLLSTTSGAKRSLIPEAVVFVLF